MQKIVRCGAGPARETSVADRSGVDLMLNTLANIIFPRAVLCSHAVCRDRCPFNYANTDKVYDGGGHIPRDGGSFHSIWTRHTIRPVLLLAN